MKRALETTLLLLLLVLAAGLVLGLTYAPCYASLCSEDFLPYETRLHIATYYALLASIALALFGRTYSRSLYQLSTTHLARKPLPVFQKHVSVGGLALAVWIVGITLVTTAFWVGPELEYWGQRTDVLEWASAKVKLGVTGIIGHHADFLLGLVIVPVSRNSLLGRVFDVHQSTLLYAHKLVAYALVVAGFAHGFAYYAFVFELNTANSERREAFEGDNPTLTTTEAESKGGWYYATLPSGMVSFVLMLVIVITALPILRRKSYNTFYYAHIICSIIIFVALSVHASTNFYFLLPGLFLWTVDWAWRLFRGSGGLSQAVPALLENVGSGWYKISLPGGSSGEKMGQEKAAVETTSPTISSEEKMVLPRPVQSYYLNFPSISKIQNHAFTAAMTGDGDSGPVFLLQRAQGKPTKKLEKEWTWKLGALVPQQGDTKLLDVRLEGPYMPNTTSYESATHVICIVGGTGLTGAYSIANWWLKCRQHDSNARLDLIWTLRHPEMAEFEDWEKFKAMVDGVPNMAISEHVSSVQGRLDASLLLQQQLKAKGDSVRESGSQGNAWVYCSGPEGLLGAVESACIEMKRVVNSGRRRHEAGYTVDQLEWYLAKWEV